MQQISKHLYIIGKFLFLTTVTVIVLSKPLGASQSSQYLKLVDAIDTLMQQHHYNPSELDSEAYKGILESMKNCAKQPQCTADFQTRMNELWQNGPFSHVNLTKHQGNAEQLAMHLDNMRVGDNSVKLHWDGDIAILTVNTMMGVDTIENIEVAYAEIQKRGAISLIIDLRNNQGGAFATRPLVSHLIKTPIQVGFFVSQNWFTQHSGLPEESHLSALPAWKGWSIQAFWQDVIANDVIKVQFEPVEPLIEAPVFILTSEKTASASELAIDALKSAGRATVIGEQTAGKMLSQKPFDLPGGYQLFLPVADYYSIKSGRIEGNPIQPDVVASAELAMTVAKSKIASGNQ